MTDDIEYIDTTAREFANSPRPLLDAINKLQNLVRAATEERDFYRAEAGSAALQNHLSAYWNPKRVERDLLDDGVDPLSPEAVQTWLTENGDAYAPAELDY